MFLSRLSFALALTALLAGAPFTGANASTATDQRFVPSVLAIDAADHTATFPLHRGTARGKTVWYILTDASDVAVAKADRIDYAPDLAQLGSDAIEQATLVNGAIAFAGAPDFSPTRTYVAGPTGFPPKSATPGAVADDAYSPFVHVDGIAGILNAPIVAVGDGPFDVTTHTNTHDRVLAIDTAKQTVTLALARGFSGGKAIYYLSTDASDPVASAVERATYVPRLAKANPGAAIPIGVVVNGALDGANKQGLDYLALRTPLEDDATAANAPTIGSPSNVLSLLPSLTAPYASNGYSPLWSVDAGAWSQSAIDAGKRTRLTGFPEFAASVQWKPAGFSVNCPAISLADDY